MRSLRIAIADDERVIREFFEDALRRLGHEVTACAASGRELIEACRADPPDMVIADIRMPKGDGIEAAIEIVRHHPVPVILVSAYHEQEYIQRAEAAPIMSYLVKPVTMEQLKPAVALALRRFEQFEAVSKDAADLRQALEERKVIERAKGIIMKQAKLHEEGAFARLRKLARDRNQTLVEVAELVLTIVRVLEPNAKKGELDPGSS